MNLYRTATANQYDLTQQNINRRSQELATQQERLSSGKRVLRASDDAVSATLSERAQNRLARVEADKRALEASRTALTQAESALGEATDIVHNVRELLVQAGNPVLGARERADLAQRLTGLRDQMLSVANRTDTSGLTLFGGLGGAAKPFVDLYGPQGGAVSFEGQPGQYLPTSNTLPNAIDGAAVWMQVPQGNGTFVATLNPGNQGALRSDLGAVADPSSLPSALTTGLGYEVEFVTADTFTILDVTANTLETISGATPVTGLPNTYRFEPGKTLQFSGLSLTLNGTPQAGDRLALTGVATQPGDLFQTLNRTISALQSEQPNRAANLTQELARGLQEVDAGLDRILAARGRLGEWLNQADTLAGLFEDQSVAYQKEDSRLTDLDLVKGISDFQGQQTALDAALRSYSAVQKLSLFQYIA
jgi:flagellar hook-associated protein 3 FlgL